MGNVSKADRRTKWIIIPVSPVLVWRSRPSFLFEVGFLGENILFGKRRTKGSGIFDNPSEEKGKFALSGYIWIKFNL